MDSGKPSDMQTISGGEDPTLDLRLTEVEKRLESFEIPIFRMLISTLHYPAALESKAVKLANDITFIHDAETTAKRLPDAELYMWSELFQIAECVPSDHPWLDCMAQTIEILRKERGFGPQSGKMDWEELPYLANQMTEKWEADDILATPEENLTDQDFNAWKSFNMLAIKLTTDPIQWFHLLNRPLKSALEEPPVKGPVQNCRLWVACQWLITRGDAMETHMKSFRDCEARSNQMGSLCGGNISLCGVDRWEFWLKRLEEQDADSTELGLDDATKKLVSEAIEKVRAVLEKQG